MKLKELESNLQQIKSFQQEKLFYEQYITTPHLASRILFNIDQMYDDLYKKNICDLGCGTGMLSIGSSFFDPNFILGIDIDSDALKIYQENIEYFEPECPIELIQADCKQLLIKEENIEKFINEFDTCLMNPPFGTKNQKSSTSEIKNLGIDMLFLKLASKLSVNSIYSLNKSVTRDYIKNLTKNWGLKMEVVSELKYNIPKIENRNRKLATEANEKDINVDLIRLIPII